MAAFGHSSTINILVVGDASTGKSSLISTFIINSFSPSVAPVLPHLHFQSHFYERQIELIIIDTASGWTRNVLRQMEHADVIILCYSCNSISSLDNVKSRWLPRLVQSGRKIPIVLVGCKLDLANSDAQTVEAEISSILRDYPEVDTFIECSAYSRVNVSNVFQHAQKAAMYPVNSLFDRCNYCLTSECENALREAFTMFDQNDDGLLDDVEVECFRQSLEDPHIANIKAYLGERFSEGITDYGITIDGFLFLHISYIKDGRTDIPWSCLKACGLDGRLRAGDGNSG